MNKAPVVEIFETIQGEGKSIGTPCIFIRIYGCNLRCQFAGVECDTPYAVYKEKEKSILMDRNELIAKIKELTPTHIVWTGGEPMLYQDFIANVMMNLPHNYTGEVETNGTIEPDSNILTYIEQFNVSVKLKSSNQTNLMYDSLRINHRALQKFNNSHCAYFKFVCSSKNDLDEIEEIIESYPDMEVYLMPEGMTRESVIAHSDEVVQLCIKNNWHFSPREHIVIWNYQRGK